MTAKPQIKRAAAKGYSRTRTRSSSIDASLRTIVVERDSSTSRQHTYLDEFAGLDAFNGGVLLPTPYRVGMLYEIIERSNMIAQCIESYVTNTVKTGWEVQPTTRGETMDSGEESELQSFVDHANSEESLATVMEQVIRDRESVGFGFSEIIRDYLGRISLIRYAPALYTRLSTKHPDDVLVEFDILRGRRVSIVKEWRKFRRFLQVVGGKTVWFKEFGDPRPMNYVTGKFEGEAGYEPGFPATEIFHWKLPSNEAYGVPRWINQLPSIIGSREAEEVNMRYFQDNTVPPMLLTVAGGRLTAGSFKQLENALNKGTGADRQHKIMLLEAVGEGDSLDGKASTVTLKVEKLTDQRQSDGLFSEYDDANMAKVRSSFRLPPVSVGMSQDMTFATASVSAFVAESQVFAPARDSIDEVLNKQLVNGRKGLNIASARLVSRTPGITSPEMVLKALTALNVIGSVTPRAAQSVVNKMLQVELPEYPRKGEEGYEEWMDRPMVLETRNKATHEEQALKTDAIKEQEADGDIGFRQPKNGKQNDASEV